MKIDYISCTKMLYFAESVLDKDISQIICGDHNVTTTFGMTGKEIEWIIDQFEHDGLLKLESMSTEGENEYGDMNSEYDYEFFVVDKEGFEKFVSETKINNRLREKAVLPREAVLSIAQQIEKTLTKQELLRVVSVFSNMMWCFEKGTYTLTDFIFREAYSKKPSKPFVSIVAEFLNPIYFTLETQETRQKLFEYIDRVFSNSAEKSDYDLWRKEVKTINVDPVETKHRAKKQQLVTMSPKENFSWEKVEIKVKDGRQDIEIFYDGKNELTASFDDLGMADGRTENRPSKEWHFLCCLADMSLVDYESATTILVNRYLNNATSSNTKVTSVYTAKKNLSKHLKIIFSTDTNPFLNVKELGLYRPIFKMKPEPTYRQNELRSEAGGLDEALLSDEE
jgi:hypothetical protein